MHQNPRIPARRMPVVPEGRTRSSDRPARAQSSSEVSEDESYDERATTDSRQPTSVPQSPIGATHRRSSAGPDKDELLKLNKIVQHFYSQAAHLIINNRAAVPRSSTDRSPCQWFGIMVEYSDEYGEDLRQWVTADALDSRPEPMIIESYLDLADLRSDQRLFLVDDEGKRWNVSEGTVPRRTGDIRFRPPREDLIVLERWTVTLGRQKPDLENLRSVLAVVYKQCIPLFRSLFTYMKLLPATKLVQRLIRTRNQRNSIRPRVRVRTAEQTDATSSPDPLTKPLAGESGRSVENFHFNAVPSPAGPLSIDVSYRTSGNFVIDEVESLMSQPLTGSDEDFFSPSTPRSLLAKAGEAGSLPDQSGRSARRPDYSQAYGSLATYHNVGAAGAATGTSPLSALRALRDPSAGSYQPTLTSRPTVDTRTSSGRPVRPAALGSPGSRRPSLSFQPFNAPTLNEASLPRGADSSNVSYYSVTSKAGDDDSRPHSRRDKASPADSHVKPPEDAGKPVRPAGPRFSSSFANRRARLSAGNPEDLEARASASKTSLISDSPGRQIPRSRRGSGNGHQRGSSSSARTEDDDINDFIKMLEGKKESDGPGSSRLNSEVPRRISGAYGRFTQIQAAGSPLSDSVTGPIAHHRSSSSSGRPLSGIAAISTGSSPGRGGSPNAPHTPHTPAVPSRLSSTSLAADLADYNEAARSRGAARGSRGAETDDRPSSRLSRTAPRDIPTSPHRETTLAYRPPADEPRIPGAFEEYGLCDANADEDREGLSLSALLALQGETLDRLKAPALTETAIRDPPTEELPQLGPELPRLISRQQVAFSLESGEDSPRQRTGSNASSAFRPRLGGRQSRGSLNSLQERPSSGQSGSGQGSARNSMSHRGSGAGGLDGEDDALLFTMSELDARSRKSMEEARVAKGAGRDAPDRRKKPR